MPANSDTTVFEVHKSASNECSQLGTEMMLVCIADVSASQACCCIIHDEFIVSLMLAFVKVWFTKFNSLLIYFYLSFTIPPEGAE